MTPIFDPLTGPDLSDLRRVVCPELADAGFTQGEINRAIRLKRIVEDKSLSFYGCTRSVRIYEYYLHLGVVYSNACEDLAQIEFVEWFAKSHPELKDLLHHSPNGGNRSQQEGLKFKAMGTRAGWPDLQLAVPRGGYSGLFVEVKYKQGIVAEDQKRIHEQLRAQGYFVAIVRTLEAFQQTITLYLNEET